MEKKLDLFEPLIESYPIYGNVLSMLEPTDRVDDWICNNFMQLRMLNNNVVFFESYRSILDNCPYITHYRYCRNIIKKKWENNMIEFIHDMIKDDFFVLLYTDRYYLSNYNNYDKVHASHELFVYGFNDNKKEFYCYDNITGGKYTELHCKYTEIERAYWNVDDSSYYSDVHCLTTMVGSDMPDNLNPKQICNLLTEYKDSQITVNFGEKYSKVQYGVKVHNLILNTIIETGKIENKLIDTRGVCTIYEHKKVMIFRLKTLKKRYITEIFNSYISLYEHLADEYLVIRNLVLKYNVTLSKSIIERVCNKFDRAISEEIEVLDELINAINSLCTEG